MRHYRGRIQDESGVALITVMLMVVSLTAIGVFAMNVTTVNQDISANLKASKQAFYLAEAGIQHARLFLNQNQSSWNTYAYPTATNLIAPTQLSTLGTYTVTIQNAGGARKVLSTGNVGSNSAAVSNARAVIEAQLALWPGLPTKAVVTDGDLKINGNPNIMGLCGGAHSNDDMQISGNPGIQMNQGLTSSNKPGGGGSLPEGMDISGNPCVGSSQCNQPTGQQPAANQIDTNAEKDAYEAANSSAAQETIPKINPADYAPLVAALGSGGSGYILHDNCTVTTGGTCGTDGLCTGGTAVAVPNGWGCSGSTWKVAGGGTAAAGVFYAEGKVEVSGSPGSNASPWQVTIIARDDIKISGSPDLKPYPTTSTGLQNTLFVTGNDLEISGNPEADYAVGAILVHQQVKISGNPEINGFIISGDGQPTWPGDPFPPSVASSGVTLNEISGNVNLTYQCDIGCSGPGCPLPRVVLLTWREVL